MDLKPCVGLRGDRLCVGEPGPLSPEDRDRFREDKLRLVWRREACLVIFLNRDVLFLLSCPSLVLVFLLRLAILDLWLVFRAGPTLMDVFSNGVAEMDTLAPLFSMSSTTSV